MALWLSTTNNSHKKPTIVDRNLTIPNPHHVTATNTTREKTHTKTHESPLTHTTVPPQRPREREGRDSNADPHQKSPKHHLPTPKPTKHHLPMPRRHLKDH